MKYLALTIGPIHRTFTKTRSTRALWSASYMFSYIMRETIKKLKSVHGVTFLTHDVNDAQIFKTGNKVGLFHDRFIASVATSQLNNLKQITHKTVKDIAGKMATDFADSKVCRDGVVFNYTATELESFLKKYLQIYALEIDTDESDPVPLIDSYLNGMELTSTFVSEQTSDYLGHFFEDLFYNFFIRDEFEKVDRFPSTVEISTQGFKKFNSGKYGNAVTNLRKYERDADRRKEMKQQENFLEAVRTIANDRFKLCHKYIAIVQADGDNMGKLFGKLPPGSDQKMAKHLKDFSLAAVNSIVGFGATPVYAGGDDLLFFAPVVTEGISGNRQTIFDLINKVDKDFEENFIKEIPHDVMNMLTTENASPSMTYGISISYYKYPLGESLDKAGQLMYGAKNSGRKNAVNWTILKHSGQDFSCLFHKTEASFTKFNAILNEQLTENPALFLASVIYKLEDLKGLFKGVANLVSTPFNEHVHNLLCNNFNESIHRAEDASGNKILSPFLQKTEQLISAVFAEHPTLNTNEKLEIVYAALRFVHFINTDDKE